MGGIILSNAFENFEKEGMGLFLKGARFNHSCRPCTCFDFAGWTQRFWTTRDVRAGEELTDCYSDTTIYFKPWKHRQKVFLEKYGFGCLCSICNLAQNATSNAGATACEQQNRKRLKRNLP